MSDHTRPADQASPVRPVRRVNYFTGQVLTPEDFQAEQDYHRGMRYLHNRLIGHGVVEGLDVTADGDSAVLVSPGCAIDAHGREIVLTDPVRVDPATWLADGRIR